MRLHTWNRARRSSRPELVTVQGPGLMAPLINGAINELKHVGSPRNLRRAIYFQKKLATCKRLAVQERPACDERHRGRMAPIQAYGVFQEGVSRHGAGRRTRVTPRRRLELRVAPTCTGGQQGSSAREHEAHDLRGPAPNGG